MKFIKILLFILLAFPLVAQVKPNEFAEETNPNNGNFEVYSQKSGANRRATMDNLKKYFAPQIYGTITYVPTLTGNTANKMQFVIDPNLDRWYIDKDGVAFLLSRTHAGGDLSGSYPNPTVYKIQGRNVASTAPSGGQVLKWNVINNRWEPGPDSTGVASMPEFYQLEILNPLPSQPIQRGSIALKKYDLNDNIEVYYSTGSDWVLAGKMLNVKTVDSVGLLPGAVKAVHLGRNGASTGQVMKWNGTTWVPASINQALVFGGPSGIPPGSLPSLTDGPFLAFNEDHGEIWHYDFELDGWLPGGSSVSAIGDIDGDGSSGAPLRIAQNGATDGQVLKWSNSLGFWTPGTDAGGISALTGDVIASGTGSVTATIANGAITGAKLANGAVNDSLKMAANVVSPTRIPSGGIHARHLNQMGATTDQILKWNGTKWGPAADAGVVSGTVGQMPYFATTSSFGSSDNVVYNTSDGSVRIGQGGTTSKLAIDNRTNPVAGPACAIYASNINASQYSALNLYGNSGTFNPVLRIYNNSGVEQTQFSCDGTIYTSRIFPIGTTTASRTLYINSNNSSTSNVAAIDVFNGNTFGSSASAVFSWMRLGGSFSASSGANQQNILSIESTFFPIGTNTTIFSGLNINVNDTRATSLTIKSTIGAGVLQESSAITNKFAGKTIFGATSAPGAMLHVVGPGATSATWTAQFHNSTGASNTLMLRDDGLIGVGTASPIARLTIAPGTSSVPPLMIPSGILTTSPSDGNIENSGSDFYGTVGSSRQIFIRGFKGAANLDFPSTSPGTFSVLTTTDANAVAGDNVTVGNPFAPGSGAYIFDAGCNVDGTVWIRLNNYSTGSTIDPSSATFKYRIIK